MNLNSYIAKQFGDPTGPGGKLVSHIMNQQNRPLYEETIRLLAPADTDSVLDIGCGNGYVLQMIARQSGCTLTGIDTSASIIKAAVRCNRLAQATLLCQNASEMSFADHTFSKAYTINTVYFWEDLSATMAEIQRVLKPGGLFINTLYSNETLSQHPHTQFGYKRYTAEQLISAGTSADFAAKVVLTLNGAAYCVVYRKAS